MRRRRDDKGPTPAAAGPPPATSAAWVTQALESITDALFVLDGDWRFVHVNRQAALDAGEPAAALVGRALWEKYPALLGTPLEAHYRCAVREQTPVHFEMRGLLSGRWLDIRAYPFPGGLVVYSRDGSQRRRAEEALRESEERFQAFMDHSPAVAFMKDEAGRYVYVNRAFEQRYGRGLADLRGLTDFEVWPADVARAFREADRATLEAGAGMDFLDTAPDPDGSPQSWRAYKFPFRDAAGGLYVGGIAVNLTPQLKAEEELRALSQRLLEVQEQERRRLSRELHDEVGQLLTGLSLTLGRGERLDGDGLREAVGEARALLRDLTARVRDLSLRLRPSMLDDLGLLPALLWLLPRYTAQTGVRVAFRHEGLERRFSPEGETAAYRIVQEALTNVARHARVGEAAVQVSLDAQTLRIVIEDRGVGFDPEAAASGGAGCGLSGMRQRAALLGGRLELAAAAGAGTRLSAEWPEGAGEGDRHGADARGG
ncbi:MAG TPA: PAS domain-containing protein [Gemmataceae bacterium]|nr:PAS domain-containing protein [Gemmataceae bacterium]